MPTTTGGSQRGDATSSFERRLIRVEDGVRQLRERAARPQKIPAAATGGITGVTRLTAGNIVQSNAAAPVGSSVTFADYTIAALFGDAVSVTESATVGQVTFADAGFYMASAYVRLAWDSGDAVEEVRVSADFLGADPYPLWFHRLGTVDGHGGGGPSLRGVFPWGPFYVDAGGWTAFGINWQTGENCFLSAMALDVWQVG